MKPAEIEKYKVCNMPSYKGTGDAVANQFVITINTNKGVKRIFQSYDTIIAVRDEDGCVTLDKDYRQSTTTERYLNQFLNNTKPQRRILIEHGVYQLADLN